jgi:hypothetical protein
MLREKIDTRGDSSEQYVSKAPDFEKPKAPSIKSINTAMKLL